MSKIADIYDGSRHVGEIHEHVDYEAAAAAGIVGCLAKLAVFALFGVFIAVGLLIKAIFEAMARHPKAALVLIGVVAAILLAVGGVNWLQQSNTVVAATGITGEPARPASVPQASTKSRPGSTSVPRASKKGQPESTSAAQCTVKAPGLNLRADRSTRSRVVARLTKGQALVASDGKAKSGWMAVQTKEGIEGWVAAEFITCTALSSSQALTPPAASLTDPSLYHIVNVQNGGRLNVRARAGVEQGLVGVIPYDGTGIRVVGPGTKVGSSMWVPIRYKGITGWVNSHYLAK